KLPFAKDVLAAAGDSSPAVRMGVLLALRREKDGEIARFLKDREPRLVEEAVRAIYDVPVSDAMSQLAALAGAPGLTEATLHRVVNANFRLGQADEARSVAAMAATTGFPESVRVDAVSALGEWGAPSGRDRVLGSWRPLPKRDGLVASDAFRSKLAGIFRGSDKVSLTATRVAAKLDVKEVGPVLRQLLADREQSPRARVEALEAVVRLNDPKVPEAMELALEDSQAEVRVVGRRVLARLQPEAALTELATVLDSGELIEQQAALALLGEIKGSGSAALLVQWLDKALQGTVPVEMQLDLLEAAAKRPLPQVQERVKRLKSAAPGDDPLSAYRLAIAGGNAERGSKIFFENSALSCVRCHKINERGGEVGP